LEKVDFLLASKSPRRIELLRNAGFQFSLIDVNVDESKNPGEEPRKYVSRMAYSKSCQGFIIAEKQTPCLGADTIVVKDKEIFGKPKDFEDCRRMLGILSGSCHEVITAICLFTAEKYYLQLVESQVEFRHVSEQDIADYWNTGEPKDKAGSYAIQGIGAKFVRNYTGSLTNIIGLPMEETQKLLQSVISK